MKRGNKMYSLYRSYDYGIGARITSAILVILAALSAIAIAITINAPRTEDGASRVFGHELRLVQTNSMRDSGDVDTSNYKIKSFKENTLVATERVPEDEAEAAKWYANIAVGDVLTFRYLYDRETTITHRVTSITPKEDGSGYIIELSGDNKDSDQSQLYQTIDTSMTDSSNYIMGKVVWKSHFFGVLVSGIQRVMKAFYE